jgi:hypothetical protein
MKTYKFHNLTVSNRAPKAGDRVICINPTHKYYGEIETVSEALVKYKAVDTTNWMVIEEESAEVQPTATTKHTPAPWLCDPMNISGDGRPYPIYAITHNFKDKNGKDEEVFFQIANATTIENARLIASAPELLEALEYVIKWHRDNDSGEGEIFWRDYITTAIAAIRKAKGE